MINFPLPFLRLLTACLTLFALPACSLFSPSDPGTSVAASSGTPPTLTVQCSTDPCTRDSTVTVFFTNLPGNYDDTIAITPADDNGAVSPNRQYSGGAIDGSVTYTNLPVNTLVARLHRNYDFNDQEIVSAPFTVTGPPPALIATCSDDPCTQSSTVTVAYANLPGYVEDALKLVPLDGADGEPLVYQLTGGFPEGTATFTNLIAGALEARAYRNFGDVIARAPITVVGKPSTIALSCSETPCRRSSTVTATFANLPGNYYDLIAFAPAGSPLGQHLATMYYGYFDINGARTATELPSGVPIVARVFKDVAIHGFEQLVAESAPITLEGDPPSLTLSCSETPCRRSSTVTVTYANLDGYAYDFVSFYRQGAPLGNGYTPIQYTSGVVNGQMAFTGLPGGVPIVARAFRNQDFLALVAESAPITLPREPSSITIGCAPFCKVTDTIDATYTWLSGFFYEPVYVFTYPEMGALTQTLDYTVGHVNGAFHFGTLPVGTYVVATAIQDLSVSSAPFTVGPVVPVCGDGVRDPGTEECDDGNLAAGDSCSPTCTITALAAAPRTPPTEQPPAPARTLGEGRHPTAAGDKGFAVTFVEDDATPSLTLAPYTSAGVPLAPISIGDGTDVLMTSDPVVAALPDGRYAAAWSDLVSGTMGDGDGLGIALRIVDPAGAKGAVTHANVGTAFNQYSPDIVFTGTQVIVAWGDESNPDTKLDVRYRVFSSTLSPLSGDLTLAQTADAESDVALASFAGSWAAAWRVATDAGEVIRVSAQTAPVATWSIGPFPPGPAGERPALVALDDTHLAVVFLQGVDVGGTGVANGAKPSVAVLDLATPGVVSASDVPGALSDVTGAAHPSAAKIGGSVFVAWEANALSSATPGTHIWLKPIPWTSTLDLSRAETPLAHRAELRVGDQVRGNVCATPLAPTGGLLETWVDLGQTFAHSKGEIGVQLVPRPD